MPDLKKVIKSVDICRGKGHCEDCQYYQGHAGYTIMDCRKYLLNDVLELLKQQTKTKVVFRRTKDGKFVTECGNCGTHLDKAYSNCPKCNKELDWNINQN